MLRLLPFLISLLVFVRMAGAAPVLESIPAIRALPPEEAERSLPVSVEAVVTFRNPGHPALVAYDGREGIYVSLVGDLGADLTTGMRLRIEGVTQPGGFLPIIECHRVTVLGREALPEPLQINPAELFSPSLDCQWVQIPAIITGVEEDNGFVLVAEVFGWTVKLVLPASADLRERAARLMQRPVSIRGVVGTVFNAQRQLTGRHFFVPSFDHITPTESSVPAGDPRLRAINELLRSDATAQTRVRVRGIVTHAAGDSLYLRGEGGSLFVRAASTEGLTPGTLVEAEGFAAVAPFRPMLRATQFTMLQCDAPPEPEPLDLRGGTLVGQQAELVSVEADLLALRSGSAGEVILQCRAGDWFFEALLPSRAEPTFHLEAGDVLRLTGICELTSTWALPFSGKVDGFRLHLRTPEDIAILRQAPWWTLRRLLWALGIVGALALMALAWAAMLRRRVADQTQIIGAQIERAAVKDERQRIARELHDTIEQELAGVSMQIRNARQRLAHAPEQAGAAFELAERMLRHCRAEARTSIRDLRSVALEQRGLPGALEELLAPLVADSGARFEMEVVGEPRSLPGPVEIHLLRIATEAVANAARHAVASEIRVRLEYASNTVTLEIRDDGRGFDPAQPAPRGHFGVLGIRERATKLHAALHVESAPGAGTTIRVVVPAEAATRAEIPLS